MTSFKSEFENAVSLPTGLWSRWWFTKGDGSYEAIFSDMKNSIVDAGVVRIEVAKGYNWTDSKEDMAAFYYVLKAANELGLRLDFATGTPYPAEIGVLPLIIDGKTYYDPKSIGYDMKKRNAYALKYAVKDVGDGLIAAPVLRDVSVFARQGFFGPAALTAGQNVSLKEDSGEEIVATSAVCVGSDGKTVLAAADLAGEKGLFSGKGGDLAITVTSKALAEITGYTGSGNWKIFSYFTELSPRNSVCYLNYYATRMWLRWFDDCVIGNDRFWTEVMGLPKGEVRRLFNKVATGLWEDSLEAIPVGYTKYALVENGTDLDIFAAFERLCGYRLSADKLTALFIGGNGLYSMGGNVSDDADFVIDSARDKQIRHDFFDVLTKLYCDNHLQIYTDWAKAQPGALDTRVQAAYLYALDQDKAFHHVTIPEYESLNSSDRMDANRAVAGAAHAAGLNTISYEMGARSVSFTKETYSMAWYDWLWHCNTAFVSGINATVLHGIEYLYGRSAKVWPGPCMAMPNAGLAEPTGQRMPYFKLMKKTISPYLAREQYILTRGKPSMDVAVYYYYNEVLNDYLDFFLDPSMQNAGYCYEFLGDDSLRLAADCCDSKALLPKAHCYRALVINQYRKGAKAQSAPGPGAKQPKAFEGGGYMPLDTARLIMKLAEKGLPVVIVGKAPDKAAKASDGGSSELAQIFEALKGLKNVGFAETEANVPAVLASLGVTPRAEFSADTDNTDLVSHHRMDENADYYMLFNRSHTVHWKGEVRDPAMLEVNPDRVIETDVVLTGSGLPYRLDCWTGEIFALPYQRLADGRVKIHVRLEPSEALMVTVREDLDETPEPAAAKPEKEIAIGDWSLDLRLYKPTERWLENPTVSCEMRPVEEGGMTTIDYETITGLNPAPNGQLLPWMSLSIGKSPERASGIGVYKGEFTIPHGFDQSKQAILAIDEATELFTVTINGVEIPFPQTAAKGSRQNVARALRQGKNSLEITVASGLWNAAKYYNTLAHEKNEEIIPQLSKESWLCPDGLIGNVKILI